MLCGVSADVDHGEDWVLLRVGINGVSVHIHRLRGIHLHPCRIGIKRGLSLGTL